MNKLNREIAERALKKMFIGSQLDGVRFGLGPSTLLIRFEHYENHVPDQLWLNIKSFWNVFPEGNEVFPSLEAEMKEMTEEQEYKLIFELRRESDEHKAR
ncbi:hypothetical protein [Paenibacillus sp. NPDC058071]|uniref:hypothetical protein n=1 Tax=Paenibacillus sp. NPDC058071 TaxID=3346326 RepID=UPI0036DEE0EE